MTALRFVRVAAIGAAVATALVAAFPLWGVADAAEPAHYSVAQHERGDRGHGDKKENKRGPKTVATCTLTVPANPLSAAGLATPYVLNNGAANCNEGNADTAAFVEATIVDGAGNLSVYRPLVIDQGTTPAATPTPVTLPAGAVVGIWFGFQGDALKLVGPGAKGCVNGQGNSLFGQFAYCNAEAFFAATQGVTAPMLATAADGLPCPTVRDFSVVDQDQSDNVSTVYRINDDGQTAQVSPAGVAATNANVVNASDNGLLNRKINPALGCTNFTAPDLTNPGGPQVPALALNEIQARQQGTPVALIPLNDPMAMRGDMQNLGKVGLYRVGVGQPPATKANANGATYCKNLKTVYPARAALDANLATFQAANSSPEAGVNLSDFLNARFAASLVALGCKA